MTQAEAQAMAETPWGQKLKTLLDCLTMRKVVLEVEEGTADAHTRMLYGRLVHVAESLGSDEAGLHQMVHDEESEVTQLVKDLVCMPWPGNPEWDEDE